MHRSISLSFSQCPYHELRLMEEQDSVLSGNHSSHAQAVDLLLYLFTVAITWILCGAVSQA